MGASEYSANKVLEHIVGKTEFAMPTAFLAVSTTDPDVSVTEPLGGSYSRIETSGSDWASASGKTITNASILAFTQATGSWGTPAYGVLYDALTGGNVLCSGPIGSPESIGSGDTLKVAAGDLVLSLN